MQFKWNIAITVELETSDLCCYWFVSSTLKMGCDSIGVCAYHLLVLLPPPFLLRKPQVFMNYFKLSDAPKITSFGLKKKFVYLFSCVQKLCEKRAGIYGNPVYLNRWKNFVSSESNREILLEMIACVEACVCYERVE